MKLLTYLPVIFHLYSVRYILGLKSFCTNKSATIIPATWKISNKLSYTYKQQKTMFSSYHLITIHLDLIYFGG